MIMFVRHSNPLSLKLNTTQLATLRETKSESLQALHARPNVKDLAAWLSADLALEAEKKRIESERGES